MTVLVRPVPKRAGSNGIRPFVRPPANNIRPYTIKNWRPPVPEPLPPAPLLGPKELLGLGLLVLAQIWGRINKNRAAPVVFPGVSIYEGFGDWAGTVDRNSVYGPRLKCTDGSLVEPGWVASANQGVGATASYGMKLEIVSGSQNTVCALSADSPAYVNKPWVISYKRTTPTGPWVVQSSNSVAFGDYKSTTGWSQTCQISPKIKSITLNGVAQPIQEVQPEPDKEAVPESVPQLPPLITPVKPAAPPAVEPETQPEIAPVEPGPSRPPTTTPRPPVFRPVKPNSPTGIKDGAIVPKPADPVVVTDPDWHFPIPGGGPITGNGPRPTPEEMAKELGRLEQKLNSILNPTPDTPMEWQNWLEQIREALFNLVNGKTYTLTEDCNPDNDPNYTPRSWDFNAPGALNAFGVIENRLDALAAMIDQSLRAKQQVCLPTRTRPVGELVTVNFIADEKPPGSSAYLRKQMRYRDSAGRSEAEHVAHWLDFEWQAGPAIVTSKGAAWGVVQVWAADPAEGRRVIDHAAAIAGVDLTVPDHMWEDSVPRSPRYGRTGRMRTERDATGTPCVSKRVGAAGRPEWALDL